MSRKKFIIYLLIVLTLVMIVDIRYVRSNNHLFAGFITESIENMITMEGNIFQSNYDSDSIKAEKEDSLELDQEFLEENQEIDTFYLKNDFGSINLQGSEEEEIKVDYTLKVHAEDKDAAEEFIKDLEVIYNVENDQLNITLNKSQTDTPDLINVVEIDYRITIPANFKTELINQYGELSVYDLNSELKADNRYGQTRVENIKEAVELELAYGQSNIVDLESTLDLDSSYAENKIKNIAGRFNLESAYGFNTIENLDSDLIINSRYGGAEITSAENIQINSRYTGYKFRDISGKIEGDIEYGDLNLANISDLELELRYADFTIESIRDYELYNYDLSVKYGDIEMDFNEFSDSGGKQFVYQGSNAEHDIVINSEYGDINIK